MIEYIKGELTDVTPAFAVIESHGVGYGLNISLNTFSAIQGKKEVRLWVYEAIREDAYVLFGFATKKEREMFLLLISVSGVGANTARMILSEMTVAELCNVISSGNERMLKSVKGIGLRTAQRIIVDLKDKIVSSGVAEELSAVAGQPTTVLASPVKDEAVGALTMLGFAPAPSSKVVMAILKEQPDMPVEQVVKLALKQIK
ncbi:MAG: Holliday junction branch migration protein RuvA [Prevotella koreensis]|uniref:Holliday junction branch migration protein RuvA n=1 Tax=Prevotella koreensis TaxID=2490854 RepID=UPI003FA10356